MRMKMRTGAMCVLTVLYVFSVMTVGVSYSPLLEERGNHSFFSFLTKTKGRPSFRNPLFNGRPSFRNPLFKGRPSFRNPLFNKPNHSSSTEAKRPVNVHGTRLLHKYTHSKAFVPTSQVFPLTGLASFPKGTATFRKLIFSSKPNGYGKKTRPIQRNPGVSALLLALQALSPTASPDVRKGMSSLVSLHRHARDASSAGDLRRNSHINKAQRATSVVLRRQHGKVRKDQDHGDLASSQTDQQLGTNVTTDGQEDLQPTTEVPEEMDGPDAGVSAREDVLVSQEREDMVRNMSTEQLLELLYQLERVREEATPSTVEIADTCCLVG